MTPTRLRDPLELLADVPPRPFPTYHELSYNDCLTNHLLPNTPFLLAASATAHWLARRDWALSADTAAGTAGPSRPNFAALRRYAHHVVPTADTCVRDFSEFARDERPLGEVLEIWKQGGGAGLYVKDWHLAAEVEREGGWAGDVYEPPECLRDDWLNPPFDPTTCTPDNPPASGPTPALAPALADFRFTYLGPAGTYTPLHRDVYGSYSWSANIIGRKVWWLFPPGAEPCDARGEPVFDVRDVGAAGGVKVLQQEGEVIFVPSGWYHQVVNVDFCISINHNFFASPTLPRIFASMAAAQARVEDSIADVRALIQTRLAGQARDEDDEAEGVEPWEREWAGEVQALLERDAGWGWAGFWETVRRNLTIPPAPGPPRARRDAFVREVVDAYRARRDWAVMRDVRVVVSQVDALVQG